MPVFWSSRLMYLSFLGLICACGAIIWESPTPSFAQTAPAPSQLLPQNLRPSAAPALGSSFIGSPLEIIAPKGSQKAFVSLDHIDIENGFAEFTEASHELIAPLLGQRHSIADLYALANALEQIYAQAGFVLVLVNVPHQQLRDHGTLHLHITDGFIEEINIDHIPAGARDIVRARTQALLHQRHIKLSQIERALLFAGQIAGISLKSTLARGNEQGGSKIILEATSKPFSFSITTDNRLPLSIGTWEQTSLLGFNNPFGFGEQIYSTLASSTDFDHAFDSSAKLRTAAFGTIIPIGADGWSFNPEYTYSRSRPTPTSGSAQTLSHFQRLSARLDYLALLTRTQSLTYSLRIEDITQSSTYEASQLDISSDHYRVARLSANFETDLPWFYQNLQITPGLSQGLGGRKGDNIPLSRQGASSSFTKMSIDARLTTQLNETTQFVVFPHAQTSFGKAVLSSEQLSLDGAQSISNVPSGSYSVDEGMALRAELQHNIAFKALNLPLSPYLFAAGGYGVLNDPTALETAQIRAAALGLGLRSQYAIGQSNITASAEVAREYSHSTLALRSWRSFVSLGLSF